MMKSYDHPDGIVFKSVGPAQTFMVNLHHQPVLGGVS